MTNNIVKLLHRISKHIDATDAKIIYSKRLSVSSVLKAKDASVDFGIKHGNWEKMANKKVWRTWNSLILNALNYITEKSLQNKIFNSECTLRASKNTSFENQESFLNQSGKTSHYTFLFFGDQVGVKRIEKFFCTKIFLVETEIEVFGITC